MILIIRISGLVEVPTGINEALYRLRLRRKYSAVLVQPTPQVIKLLNKLRNFIAYGNISKKGMEEIIQKRGISINKKKIDAASVVDQLDKKDLQTLGIKPFFRLHPPIGGIDSKIHYPMRKGVLGDHKDKIEVLMRRML